MPNTGSVHGVSVTCASDNSTGMAHGGSGSFCGGWAKGLPPCVPVGHGDDLGVLEGWPGTVAKPSADG